MVSKQLENTQALDQLLNQLAEEGKITPELSRDIQNGTVKLMPTVQYIRADVSGQGGGEIELLKASQDEETGVSTFNGQRLPNGQAIIGTAVLVRYGEGENIKDVSLDKKLPGALQGSNIISKSDSKEVFNITGSMFLTAGSNTAPEDQMFRPELPVFLPDGKKTEFRIEVPSGVSFPSPTAPAKGFVEVAIYGYKTVNR